MLRIIFFIVVVLLSSTVNVNGQTCQNTAEYSACSSNRECGCLPLSFASSFGICGIASSSNCSQFVRCQSPNDLCAQSGYVCVRHSRCDSSPICYPMEMASQRACPITIVSNYSSALTTSDGLYVRPGTSSSSYYYEAVQLVVDTTGTYDISSLSGMDTHGFLYNGTFYPLNPSQNLVHHNDDSSGNNQFKLPVTLVAGVPYTVVLSTHAAGVTGPFSIVASGPGNVQYFPINTFATTTSTTTRPSIINTYYSSSLTMDSANYSRSGPDSIFYYEALEVTVNTTGDYTFTSTSAMDTYGYLYQGNFYPSSISTNKLKENDDGTSGSRGFQITATLQAGMTYVLVATTYSQNVIGAFSITASGPDDVSLIPIDNYS